MKKQFVIYLLSGVMTILLMTGCQQTEQLSGVEVNAAPLINPTLAGDNSSASVIAHGANDFAFRLSAELAGNRGDENLVVSPYSVWLPLAALLNATHEAQQQELIDALGAVGVSVADINQAASRMLFDLTNEGRGDDSPLRIANAIFVDYRENLRTDFVQQFMDYFRGTMFNVDFSSQAAVDAVNQWASDQTDGLISDIIEEFSSDAIAAIANAIHFVDIWQHEFNPNRTRPRTFYSPSGGVTADFMERDGTQPFFADDTLQAIRLDYLQGGSLYILMPNDGNATDLLATMTNEKFMQVQANLTLQNGQLLLPRFEIESTINELPEMLTALGVPLFDELTAPLTGGLVYSDERVWLGQAVQKALIIVDEEGTTAAAVTVMEIVAESLPMWDFALLVDRPFVFILTQPTHDGGSQILFTGVVNQP